ncbi:c-type cytochrome biogenesis protein CcsB [Allobranchiibius sp. CTAmp26]|uniref:c-type cytochrome biogenesis protein CcsB n=1 Tax=Allobranchiibius sp. CTAmp26 TaxID=2815214 RepID=UPI001AA106D0|nr:c-type cytochrome biogenesis protein CcsB [Allobranchiibius sp. CTAmp26]MBO1753639.1 c-type cytochrome biogenesis protein CcsB [Allobranchiibius sp. CTAmp26]
MKFDFSNDHIDTGIATLSSHFLWASALVLTLAMMSFALDLAGAPYRAARLEARRSATTQTQATADGDVLVDTAVATDVAPEKRPWGGRGITLSWLGTLLLIVAVVTRTIAVGRPPLGNMYEFSMVGCMFAMVFFLAWSLKSDIRWLGVFITGPIVLFEMLAAVIYYTAASSLMPSLQSYWLSIHVTVATLSVALSTLAFSLTLAYFVQNWRDERGEAGRERLKWMDALPSAASLDRTTYGVLIVAFPMWTFTLIAGAIWAQEAWGHYWNWDPKEVWTLVIWVVYAAYLHARATAGWSGKKAAYIALAGFVAILINYGIVNVYFVGQHSYSGL